MADPNQPYDNGDHPGDEDDVTPGGDFGFDHQQQHQHQEQEQHHQGGEPHYPPEQQQYYGGDDPQYNDHASQYSHQHQHQQPYVDGEDGTYDGQTTAEFSNSIPDTSFLNHYCANSIPPRDSSVEARAEAGASWEPVREWLRTHSADEVRAGAEQRGDSAMTALHFACRNAPPPDVIDVFLSIAIDTVQWPDSFGWLPIHYACACGADKEVIKSLAEAFPESKTTVDRRGRTPLHFALGNSNPENPVSPTVVVLLSSSGAASYADDNGMLPLHYACAYGASEEALYVLTEAHPDAITTMDRRGRTPLHFALSNAGRKAAPAAVRLLLSLNKHIVNTADGGPLPLRVLAEFAASVRRDESQRESVQRCLEYLLLAKPDPTADFFTALQSLPDWLSENAVVMPVVQHLLNEKISQRFPTGVLMSDFYFQVLVIVFYSWTVPMAIDRRFDDDNPQYGEPIESHRLVPLYIGASYFLIREVVQILSLISLKSFHIWVYDPSNWLNVVYIFVIYFWTIRMDLGNGEKEKFRTGTALCVVILWLKLLGFLRNMMIDFAVFVGGVFYVVQRLVAFLLALSIIMIAFSQMFFTIYRQSDPYCIEAPNDSISDEAFFANLQCEQNEIRPYCDRWSAFLNSLTMLIGQVDSLQFQGSGSAIALFVVFMFLVVILLANVLIAIVTDSYKVIQDQRAAIVFWTNRLDFIAEMDAIANGPWKEKLKRSMGMESETNTSSRIVVTFGKDFWKRLMDIFEDDVDDGIFSMEFLCYALLRIGTVVVIIPCWIILGLFTFGWFWPPQLREAIFTSTVFKHTTDTEKEEMLRKTQVKRLETEVKAFKDELLQELAIDRTQVVQMKSLVAERKMEIQGEMKHIKRIVNLLFEQQSSL